MFVSLFCSLSCFSSFSSSECCVEAISGDDEFLEDVVRYVDKADVMKMGEIEEKKVEKKEEKEKEDPEEIIIIIIMAEKVESDWKIEDGGGGG